MEPYNDFGLYLELRNSLDEKLADRLAAVLINIPGRLRKDGTVGPDRDLLIEAFIGDLEAAVERALGDLRTDRQMRRQALAWLQAHPVVEVEAVTLYTDDEQFTLVGYYSPLLKGHPLFAGDDDFSLGFNFGEGGHLINVLIDNFAGRKETKVPLEIFIELMGLKTPAEVLLEKQFLE